MADTNMLRAFRFVVTLRKSPAAAAGSQTRQASPPLAISSNDPPGTVLGDGGFQECSGLEVEMDIKEYQEGGRNDGIIRRAGRAKYSNLILKRGMFYPDSGGVNRDLWDWLQSVISGVRPIPRYDGLVQVKGAVDDIVATWVFDRGLPAKIRGPELNGKTGEIAVEELHIAHEGLRLVSS
jgi:phage tail-like protein